MHVWIQQRPVFAFGSLWKVIFMVWNFLFMSFSIEILNKLIANVFLLLSMCLSQGFYLERSVIRNFIGRVWKIALNNLSHFKVLMLHSGVGNFYFIELFSQSINDLSQSLVFHCFSIGLRGVTLVINTFLILGFQR